MRIEYFHENYGYKTRNILIFKTKIVSTQNPDFTRQQSTIQFSEINLFGIVEYKQQYRQCQSNYTASNQGRNTNQLRSSYTACKTTQSLSASSISSSSGTPRRQRTLLHLQTNTKSSNEVKETQEVVISIRVMNFLH